VGAPTFEELLDRHQREIMGYIVRSLRDQDLAQDAFQETFLRAFRAYGRLPAEANHRAWLYKIASNACHDAHRQRVRSPLPLDDSLPGADPPGSDDREMVRAVVDFIHALPARQRQSVALRKFQGLDYDEIASVLGCSPEAARANVYQGLRKVRAQFAEVGHG